MGRVGGREKESDGKPMDVAKRFRETDKKGRRSSYHSRTRSKRRTETLKPMQ